MPLPLYHRSGLHWRGEDTPAAGAYGGVRGNLFVCEIFLRGFQSIFEPDGQNAQKQGGKFGG